MPKTKQMNSYYIDLTSKLIYIFFIKNQKSQTAETITESLLINIITQFTNGHAWTLESKCTRSVSFKNYRWLCSKRVGPGDHPLGLQI